MAPIRRPQHETDIPWRLEQRGNKTYVFDFLRKKFVPLTAEEQVRQQWLRYLVEVLGIPRSRISVEKTIQVLKRKRRFDIVAFDKQGLPLLLVECKAKGKKITQAAIDQSARYNLQLRAKYLVVTNGESTFICAFDHSRGHYEYLPHLPEELK